MRLVEHGGGRIAGGSIAFRRRDGSVLDLAQAVVRARCARFAAPTSR